MTHVIIIMTADAITVWNAAGGGGRGGLACRASSRSKGQLAGTIAGKLDLQVTPKHEDGSLLSTSAGLR